jgi:SAM-dependent methyltransferase
LPSGFSLTLQRPALRDVSALDRSLTWKLLVWRFLFWCDGTLGDLRLCQIRDANGVIAHYGFVFPRYFRFPFMARRDLQIGSLRTHASFRNLGLATAAVRQILARLNRPEQTVWYVVEASNTASISVAEKNGFALTAAGSAVSQWPKRYAPEPSADDHPVEHRPAHRGQARQPVNAARDFSDITELPGTAATRDQLMRFVQRYEFAAVRASGRRVLEVACGGGQGLSLLRKTARRVVAGDFTHRLATAVHAEYGESLPVARFDAEAMPFSDRSFDLVVMFEAVYYLSDADRFMRDAARVLDAGGALVLSTVNPEWSGFSKSIMSTSYWSAAELQQKLATAGFSNTQFYGGFSTDDLSLRSRAVAAARRAAATLNVIPGTLRGRERLKRLAYGPTEPLPAQLQSSHVPAPPPVPLTDLRRPPYKIVYVVAQK